MFSIAAYDFSCLLNKSQIKIGDLVKIKHIIAICLVLALVLPSTAFAAAVSTPTLKIQASKYSGKAPLTTVVSYSLTGAKELNHTWYLGTGFSCHCHHRTYTYTKPGTYTVTCKLKTTTGKTLIKTMKIQVYKR
jgi:PKD repeat protein